MGKRARYSNSPCFSRIVMAATRKSPTELEKASKLAHVPKGEEYEKMISGMLYVPIPPYF